MGAQKPSSAISPAEAAAIQLAIRIATDIVSTASDVIRMRSETIEFMKRADTLCHIVNIDAQAATNIIQPMLVLLMQHDQLATEERLAIVSAIRSIGEIGARARGDAMRELAKKV